MSTIKTIVFQGDSITDAGRAPGRPCNNDGLGGGYVQLAAARLLAAAPERDLKIYNTGISGHRIVDLYARWKVDTLQLAPDLISIMVGVNDVWHEFGSGNGVELDRYEFMYRELLQWTRKQLPSVKFLLMDPFVLPLPGLPPEMVAEVAPRRPVVLKLAREFDAAHLPVQELFDVACRKAPAAYWSGDGVHPTLAGHQLLADAWLELAQTL